MQKLRAAFATVSIFLFGAATFGSAAATAGQISHTGQTPPPLKLIHRFQMPDSIKGHFDHFTVDAAGKRLFAAAVDDKVIAVFDFEKGELTRSVGHVDIPRAILYRPEVNRIYVSDGGGAVRIFNAQNFNLEKSIPLLEDADPIAYDSASKRLYVVNGGADVHHTYSDITVIDTTAETKLGNIKVDGEELEGMAVETSGPRLFVNNRAKNQIDIVDRTKQAVVASWPVTRSKGNTAVALDETTHRLFIGCRGGQMIIFDTNTGKELASVPIGGDVDDIAFDPATRRIYVACGGGKGENGAVFVYKETDADHYQLLGKIPSGPGAATARLVPELREYIALVPPHKNASAEVLVYRVQ